MNIAKQAAINAAAVPARRVLWVLAAAALVASGIVQAQTTADFDVTITLEESCELSTAPTDMAFGTVGLLTTDHTATSVVSVTCTSGALYTLSLNDGLHADSTSRRMENDGEHVSYRLYSDVGYTDLWGDGTTFGDAVGGTGSGVEQEVTVYGRVEAADNATTPPAGSYSDTVTVEVTL